MLPFYPYVIAVDPEVTALCSLEDEPSQVRQGG